MSANIQRFSYQVPASGANTFLGDVDQTTTSALNLGANNATSVVVGKTGVSTSVPGGLAVTGNITVTGTVDGVDLAGHVADSTIHYTQANITGTGTLTSGSIASGFGTISTANSITGSSLVSGTVSITSGDITFTGTTGANTLTMPDNLADAFSIKQATNNYMTFVTTNAAESINVLQNMSVATGKTLDLTGASITLDNNAINGDSVEGGTINAITINTLTTGALTSSAGSVAIDTDLTLSSNTVTFGDLISGNNKISIPDNLAIALDITQGATSYMRFKTTNTAETVQILQDTEVTGSMTISGDLTVSGTTTTVSSTVTSIADNLIVVNSGPAASGYDGGLLVARHQTDIVADTAAESGIAQAGSGTTITLANTANATDSYYVGWYIVTTGGTGSGQTKVITAYVGATKVATVSTWLVNPDATTTYDLFSRSKVSVYYDESQDVWTYGFTNSDPGAGQVVNQGLLGVHTDSIRVGGIPGTQEATISSNASGSIVLSGGLVSTGVVSNGGTNGDVLSRVVTKTDGLNHNMYTAIDSDVSDSQGTILMRWPEAGENHIVSMKYTIGYNAAAGTTAWSLKIHDIAGATITVESGTGSAQSYEIVPTAFARTVQRIQIGVGTGGAFDNTAATPILYLLLTDGTATNNTTFRCVVVKDQVNFDAIA